MMPGNVGSGQLTLDQTEELAARAARLYRTLADLADLLRSIDPRTKHPLDDSQHVDAYFAAFSQLWTAVHGPQHDMSQVRRLAADQLARHVSDEEPPAGIDALTDIARLLPTTVRAAPVVLDVGANVGQTVDRFLAKFPRAAIHCFEPVPSAFRRLQAHVANSPGVSINASAVGARCGSAVIVEHMDSDMSSMLEPGPAAWGTTLGHHSVPMVSVDQYCAERGLTTVDVLKIDTQGYELEVLAGASQQMRRGQIRLIYLELIFSAMYVNAASVADIHSLLASHGYVLVGMYDFHYRDGRAGWADALFCRESPGARTPPDETNLEDHSS